MHQHVTRKSYRHQQTKRETRQLLRRMDAMMQAIRQLRADLAAYQILCPPQEEAAQGLIRWKDLS